MRISKSVNLYLGELYLCYGRHYRKSVLCRAAKEHDQDSAEPGKDFAMRNHTAQLRSAKVLCRELFTNRTAKVFAVSPARTTRQNVVNPQPRYLSCAGPFPWYLSLSCASSNGRTAHFSPVPCASSKGRTAHFSPLSCASCRQHGTCPLPRSKATALCRVFPVNNTAYLQYGPSRK